MTKMHREEMWGPMQSEKLSHSPAVTNSDEEDAPEGVMFCIYAESGVRFADRWGLKKSQEADGSDITEEGVIVRLKKERSSDKS